MQTNVNLLQNFTEFFYNEKCFRQNFHENSNHTFYVQESFSDRHAFFFSNVQKYGTA